MLDDARRHELGQQPHWSGELVSELEANCGRNGRVGSALVSETDDYRVWLITLAPGERLPFHTHVLSYFWVATSPGRARSRDAGGAVSHVEYEVGTTRHMHYAAGESMTHDLENIGETTLRFTTVEDKRAPNAPLAL